MSKSYALLIGNGVYLKDTSAFPNLLAVRNDVRDLARVLSISQNGLFTNIKKILDKGSSLLLVEIEKTLSPITSEDLLLIYYSGHGKMDEFNNLYLGTRNSENCLLSSTTLPIATLRDMLARNPSQRIILILDCCYSGLAVSSLIKGGEIDALKDIANQGFGRCIITSSGSKKSWLESSTPKNKKNQNSIFTKYLVEGIKTGEADLNNDGIITVDEWYRYANIKTRKVKPEQKPTRSILGEQGDQIAIARVGDNIQSKRVQKQYAPSPVIDIFQQDVTKSNTISNINQNMYYYENIHLASAWNLLQDKKKCSIAVFGESVENDHPSLANISLKCHFIKGSSKVSKKDEFTTSIIGILASPLLENSFIGIAPGSEIQLIKILSDGFTNTALILEALDLAIDIGVSIICCPLALLNEANIVLSKKINYISKDLGIPIVIPAGNNNVNMKRATNLYNHAIFTTSVDQNDRKSPFSNYGSLIDIAAPGEDIVSCSIGNSYKQYSGTSFSCAFTVGVIALMLTANPELKTSDIKTILSISSDNIDKVNSNYKGKLGSGRINAYNSVNRAISYKSNPK